MKTYFKFLSRNTFYTFVSVFGFAVSLMFVFLIAVYVKQELSVDNFQEKKDRIFLLTHDGRTASPPLLTKHLKNRYPEIEAAVSVIPGLADEPVAVGDKKLNVKALVVQEEFFDIFSFPIIEGNRAQVLQAKNSAVISEGFARKAFPDRDPLGQTITYKGNLVLTITGVMKDIRHSIVPDCDIVFRMENAAHFSPWVVREDLGSTLGFLVILVKEGADITSKIGDLNVFFKELLRGYNNGQYETAALIPLREVYFSGIIRYSHINTGDKSFLLILTFVGVLILVFAVFNYVNLTIAQTGFRAREMAIRHLSGASREEPFFRIILESCILTVISFLLGLLLALMIASYAGNLLNTELDIKSFFTVKNCILTLLFIVVLGLAAGVFPAAMIIRINPVDIVKGSYSVKSKTIFSKVFIIIQNIITIVLIASSITIARQVNHLINAPLGYNYKNIISIPSYGQVDRQTQNVLSDKLSSLSPVKQVGFSYGIPIDGGFDNTTEYKGRSISMKYFWGDQAFFDMLGFTVLHDNNTAFAGEKIYISEKAYKDFELEEDAVVIPHLNQNISGKIKDIKLLNITFDYEFPVMVVLGSSPLGINNILVQVEGDPIQALKEVKAVFEEVTQLPFSEKYMDDYIKESFASQQRLLKIINIFTFIALTISLLGLIAISTYFIRQRIREIALRKVMGSTNNAIVVQLIQSFLNYVWIAFIIAVPVAWYFMRDWLNDYSYRISLSPLYFIIAGLFCLFVSALTVSFQSYRASVTNPVNTLKNE